MDSHMVYLTPQVARSLNAELSYQNSLHGTERADANSNGVPDQLLIMEHYLCEAREAWVKNSGDEAALDVLRKVVATGIRALVLYGCPERKGTE